MRFILKLLMKILPKCEKQKLIYKLAATDCPSPYYDCPPQFNGGHCDECWIAYIGGKNGI